MNSLIIRYSDWRVNCCQMMLRWTKWIIQMYLQMGFELLLDYKLDFTTTKTVPIRSLGKTSLWKGKYQLNPSKKTGEMARKGVNPDSDLYVHLSCWYFVTFQMKNSKLILVTFSAQSTSCHVNIRVNSHSKPTTQLKRSFNHFGTFLTIKANWKLFSIRRTNCYWTNFYDYIPGLRESPFNYRPF